MLFILVALVANVVRANQIDNMLVGDPVVDCQDTMVGLWVQAFRYPLSLLFYLGSMKIFLYLDFSK
jgi:hypothetical protein